VTVLLSFSFESVILRGGLHSL